MTSKELRAARRKLKFSQRELGEELGLSMRTIGRIENGEFIISKMMEAAMKWLLYEGGFNVS